MAAITEGLETDISGMPVNDQIVFVNNMADEQEKHIAFQSNLPEYVTPPAHFRVLTDQMGVARDNAAGGLKSKKLELLALQEDVQRRVMLNGRHVSMLAFFRNDPSILLGAGLPPKKKGGSKKSQMNLLDHEPDVYAKHGVGPGSSILMVKRLKQKAMIELSMTYKEPNIEEAWQSLGTHNESRIERKDLPSATRVYFRARYLEKGKTGRWSTPVPLIIL